MASSTVKALVPVVPPLFERILSLFPRNYFKYCFGYGSGVFKQGAACGENPMIDLIFAVDDSESFHKENINLNPTHYSGLKYLGGYGIAQIQEKWPAKVYFNTLIPIPQEKIMLKYGIVNIADLIDDLLDWNYIYLSGRLHKPVLELMEPDEQLQMALRNNLLSACHSALLILPEYFPERQLYKTITALSYIGDFRMVIGENKNKVGNIVDNQIEYFRRLYRPLLRTFHNCLDIPNDESPDQICCQDICYNARKYHLFQLPKVPMQNLAKHWRRHNITRKRDTEDVLLEAARDYEIGTLLVSILRKIISRSSIQQSVKGIFTAGFSKSITYSGNKLDKMSKSEETKVA